MNGSVKLLASSVLPVAVPVITATGGITGQLVGQPSTLYAYDVQQSGDEVTVRARATGFDLPSLGLNPAEREVADYLDVGLRSCGARAARLPVCGLGSPRGCG